jgi:hypothetical protein
MAKTVERELVDIIVECVNYDDDFGVYGFNNAVDEIMRRFKLTRRGRDDGEQDRATTRI